MNSILGIVKTIFHLLILLLPWPIKRRLLIAVYGYELDPTAYIGISIVLVEKLKMAKHSRIGNLNIVRRLELVQLGERSTIGSYNLITCISKKNKAHYQHLPDRRTELLLEEHAAITMQHILDCNESIRIGRFSTIAGYRSQLLTHSIDTYKARQSASPIQIGAYCFVGTSCILLGGAKLPDRCILGAGALLNRGYDEEYRVLAGVPARPVKELDDSVLYFQRQTGFIQ